MEVEHLGTFRDGLFMSQCLLGVPNVAPWPCHPDPREFPPIFEAPVGQSRKAVNGRLRLTVYGQTRTVPVPYKMVSQRLTIEIGIASRRRLIAEKPSKDARLLK
ncbi:hypothetical protein B0H13DRAFT_1870978 [Mycena leptocephala]|nr:hypothetical protein B0H13DRAFT_1870978 [Mycena leptocephala]